MKEDPDNAGLKSERASRMLLAVVCLVPTQDEELASVTIGNRHYIFTEDPEQEGIVFYYAEPQSLAWGVVPKIRGSLDVQLQKEGSVNLSAQHFIEPSDIETSVEKMSNKPPKATCYTIYYPKVEEGKIPEAHIVFFSRKDQRVFIPQPLTPTAHSIQLSQPAAS